MSTEERTNEKDTVPCEACGVSIAAPRWFCGRCAKDRREGRKP